MKRGVDRNVDKGLGTTAGKTHCLDMRLDKWLVYARFCKTRSQAGGLVADGKIRINGRKIEKPDTKLHIDDVMTLAIGSKIEIVRVLQLADRRSSPHLAHMMYEYLPQIGQSLE